MVALVSTVAYLGLEARTVEVQCQITPGMSPFVVVGLPDKAVRESTERVRAAIAAMGLAIGAAWSGMLSNFAAGVFLKVIPVPDFLSGLIGWIYFAALVVFFWPYFARRFNV